MPRVRLPRIIAEPRCKRHGSGQRRATILPGALLASLVALHPAPATAEEVTVFAAASLGDILSAMKVDFEQVSGHRLRFAFAASSLLARQVEAGAPARIFASASVRWMDYLESRGRIEPGTRIEPIGNRLVLIAPRRDGAAPGPSGPQALDASSMQRILGRDDRIAVGDPQHVPAGIYARQALQSLKLWPLLARRLAIADNVRAALVLVERGETPLGIVYASDVRISRRVHVVADFPPDSHDPIRYPFAVVKDRASPAAAAFMDYLRGEHALQAFLEHGFIPVDGQHAR